MQSAPVIAMALRGENAITLVRDLVGPTDSSAAPAGTIRGDLGEDKMRNIVHASDSPYAAEVELKRFFNLVSALISYRILEEGDQEEGGSRTLK